MSAENSNVSTMAAFDLKNFLNSPNFSTLLEHFENWGLDSTSRSLNSGNLSGNELLASKALDMILTGFEKNAEIQQKMLQAAETIAKLRSEATSAFSKQAADAMAKSHEMKKMAVQLFSQALCHMLAEASKVRDRAALRVKDLETQLKEIKQEAIKLVKNDALPERMFQVKQKSLEKILSNFEKRILIVEEAEFLMTQAIHAELMELIPHQLEDLKELQVHLVDAQKEISAGINAFSKVMQKNNQEMLSELITEISSIITTARKNREEKKADSAPKNNEIAFFKEGDETSQKDEPTTAPVDDKANDKPTIPSLSPR